MRLTVAIGLGVCDRHHLKYMAIHTAAVRWNKGGWFCPSLMSVSLLLFFSLLGNAQYYAHLHNLIVLLALLTSDHDHLFRGLLHLKSRGHEHKSCENSEVKQDGAFYPSLMSMSLLHCSLACMATLKNYAQLQSLVELALLTSFMDSFISK